MLRRGADRGVVRGLTVGVDGCHVSHLQFADDIILFLPDDRENFLHVLMIIQVFELVFGIRINLGKSGIAGINIQEGSLCELAKL